MSLPEHQRVIPAFDISEEGMRQLEIWLRDRLGQGGSGWRFKILNGDPKAKTSEKGWGYVRFIECFDLDNVPDPTATGGNWGAAFLDSSGCGLLVGSDSLTQIKTNGGDLDLLSDGGNINGTANAGEVFFLSQDGGTYPQVFVDADATSNSLFLGANDSFSKFAILTLDSSSPQMIVHVDDGAGAGNAVFNVGHDFDVNVGHACFFQLPAGGTLNVTNHLGAVIFRVDENGDLHGKTGKALTFDL